MGDVGDYPTHLRVVGHQWGLVVSFTSTETGFQTRGAMQVLLEYIAASMNLSYTVLKPEEQSGVNTNSSWTGVMGYLVRKEADLTITPLLMDSTRFDSVAFTTLTFMGNIKILVGRPEDQQSIFGLVSVFDTLVCLWYAALFGINFLFGIVARRTVDKATSNPEGRQLWTMFSAIFGKGVPRTPTALSTRMQFVCWYIFCLIFSNIYSGILVSSLSTSRPPDCIRQMEDFLRFPRVEPTLHMGSNEVDYFRFSDRPVQREIWRRVQLNPSRTLLGLDILYNDDTLDRVERGRSGVFQEWRMFKKALGERYRHRGKCRFIITKPYRTIPIALALRPGIHKEFARQIDKRVQHFFEADLLDNIYSPNKNDYLNCVENSQATTVDNNCVAMPLRHFYAAFIFWAIGNAIATTTFVIEIRNTRNVAKKNIS